MSAESIKVQLERIAKDMFAIAKFFDCSIGIDITKLTDEKYCGTFWKIGEQAIDFDFREDQINLSRTLDDNRHLDPRKEDA